MARRPTLSAVVSWTVAAVVPFVAGCHAGGVGNLAPRPEPNLPKVSVTAAEAIRKHNINASHVQALEAKPRITIASAEMNGSVDGRIALERPHSFKLEMFGPGLKRPVADIGPACPRRASDNKNGAAPL